MKTMLAALAMTAVAAFGISARAGVSDETAKQDSGSRFLENSGAGTVRNAETPVYAGDAKASSAGKGGIPLQKASAENRAAAAQEPPLPNAKELDEKALRRTMVRAAGGAAGAIVGAAAGSVFFAVGFGWWMSAIGGPGAGMVAVGTGAVLGGMLGASVGADYAEKRFVGESDPRR